MADSGSVTLGNGILTEPACKLADDGLDAESIAEKLEEFKKKGDRPFFA